MTMRRPLSAILILLAVAACSQAGGPALYRVPNVEAGARVGIAYRTVAVREVSLPAYAALQEIALSDAKGRLLPAPASLWADDPVRDVTLDLSRNLARLTRATVAPDPWPFRSTPEVSVDVRIEDIVADASGSFRLAGQYFVAPDDPERRERAELFEIVVPYDPAGGVAAIAAARARAVADLARRIAERGLR